MNKDRHLDFLGIGATKAGTTSLHYYLSEHPKIFLPPGKEEPFFDDERHAKGWKSYFEDIFKDAPEDARIGKITPRYMRDDRVPKRIKELMPDVKLIVILRNPIDRAVSHYEMLYRIGTIKEDLGVVIKSYLQNPQSNPFHLLRQGEYGRILTSYFDLFKRENILVLFTDDLERDPRSVLSEIFRFLDVEEIYPENLTKKYNVGGGSPRFKRIKVALARNYFFKKIWRAFPEKIRRATLLWYSTQFTAGKEAKIRLTEDQRNILRDYYKADVAKLSTLLGKKIGWNDFQ